jgi:tripartite-type tricarboxylate transporter receptor subunit TctC
MTKINKWLAMAVLAQALVTSLHAQSAFPAGPITIVVPMAAGGTSDIIARVLARSMQESLKQPVIISNKPGATGLIGSKAVQKSKPDGYTLLFTGVSTMVTSALLQNPIPFDAVRDFAPIARAVDYPLFIMTGSAIKAGNLQQLVEQAKQKDGGLTQATPGVGSVSHLACEAFSLAAGVSLRVIPYNSTRAAKQALLTNETDVGCMSEEGATAFVADGRIRLIAALSPSRNADFPNVPTAIEAGYPGLTASVWQGLFAPKGTPDEVIKKLHHSLQTALRTPEAAQLARTQLLRIINEQPAEAAAGVRADQERWARVIKEKNIVLKD